MKRQTVVLLTLFCLFFSFQFDVLATTEVDTYYNRATYKLGRGISNVLFSPIEIANSMDDRVDSYGFGGGVAIGAVHGAGRMFGRIGTGFIDILTFFIKPDPNTTLMEPEFVFNYKNS